VLPVTPAPLGATKVHGRRYRKLRRYEVLFIVRPDFDEEQIAAVIQKYKDVVVNDGGVVLTAEKWAKRRLAYEIAGFQEGIYLIVTFEGTPEIVAELDRLMKIDQQVIRHMVSRIDNIPQQVSRSQKGKAATEAAVSEKDTKSQARPEAEVVEESEPEEDTVVQHKEV
jgi:small subunit ribosomal protein S6